MKGYSHMKRQGFVALGAFVAFAFSSACPLAAQEEGEEETVVSTEETAAGDEAASEEALPGLQPADRGLTAYFRLMRCDEVHGEVLVLRPNADKPVKAELGKYYPLGSVVTAMNTADKRGMEPSSAVFDFGKSAMVRLSEGAEFSTRLAQEGVNCRTVVLRKGRIDMILPRQMKVGEFQVSAPNFLCKDLSGESTFEFTTDGHNDDTLIHLKSGLMAVEGAHYSIAQLRVGDKLRITTRDDNAYTLLDGVSGIYAVKLDQGLRRDKDPLTGEAKDSRVETVFELSPKAQVKIWRRKAKVGGRTVVSTMAMDAAGAIKTRRVFAENRFNVNSGELVVSPKDAAAAKAAAEQGTEADDTTVQAADDSAAGDMPDDSGTSAGSSTTSGNDAGGLFDDDEF